MSVYKLAEELKLSKEHIKALKFMFKSLIKEGDDIKEKIEMGKNLITLGRALKDDLEKFSEEKKMLEEFIKSTEDFRETIIKPAKEMEELFQPLFQLLQEDGMD